MIYCRSYVSTGDTDRDIHLLCLQNITTRVNSCCSIQHQRRQNQCQRQRDGSCRQYYDTGTIYLRSKANSPQELNKLLGLDKTLIYKIA
jgi:hypothetical protein